MAIAISFHFRYFPNVFYCAAVNRTSISSMCNVLNSKFCWRQYSYINKIFSLFSLYLPILNFLECNTTKIVLSLKCFKPCTIGWFWWNFTLKPETHQASANCVAKLWFFLPLGWIAKQKCIQLICLRYRNRRRSVWVDPYPVFRQH